MSHRVGARRFSADKHSVGCLDKAAQWHVYARCESCCNLALSTCTCLSLEVKMCSKTSCLDVRVPRLDFRNFLVVFGDHNLSLLVPRFWGRSFRSYRTKCSPNKFLIVVSLLLTILSCWNFYPWHVPLTKCKAFISRQIFPGLFRFRSAAMVSYNAMDLLTAHARAVRWNEVVCVKVNCLGQVKFDRLWIPLGVFCW